MNDQQLTFGSVYPMPVMWIQQKHYRYLVNHQEEGDDKPIKDWEIYYRTYKTFLDNEFKREMSL
jgi:hypothetical protein